jgi:hypothetical protein
MNRSFADASIDQFRLTAAWFSRFLLSGGLIHDVDITPRNSGFPVIPNDLILSYRRHSSHLLFGLSGLLQTDEDENDAAERNGGS